MSSSRLVVEAVSNKSPGPRGYIRCRCPLCENVVGSPDRHWALSLNTKTGWYRCWRCGSKGRAGDGYEYARSTEDNETDYPVTLPTSFYALSDPRCKNSELAEQARQYLANRFVTPETILEAHIGFTIGGRYSNRIIVPVTDGTGALVGWVGRSLGNAEPKYIYPEGMQRGQYLYNEAALLRDDAHKLLVAEGCFDCLRYFSQACAVLGKPSAAHVRKLASSERALVIALDGDAWQESRALAICLQMLGKKDVEWIKLPPGEDPSSFKVEF